MAAKDNLTKAENFSVTAREIDFVTRFGMTWQALLDILGIMRPIRKEPGAVLKSRKARVVLANGNVAEGDVTPLSEAFVDEIPYAEMGIERYEKDTSIEAIKTYGYDIAIAKTDEAFLNQLQSNVMGRFYTYLNGGELTNVQSNFQKALAMAKGYVVNKFQNLNLNVTEVVGFVNTLDVHGYLGSADITVQTQFGFNYIKNFMGYGTIFMIDGNKIPRGTVIATPVENIVLYYVDPSTSDFGRAGLTYTVDGVTNLIGFHTEGDYRRATSNCYALMGLTLFAEYIDGIAVVTIANGGSITEATLTSAAGTASGTKLTVTGITVTPDLRYFVKADTAAPTAPSYLAEPDATWTEIFPDENGVADNVGDLTTGDLAVVVVTNGSKQTIYASDDDGVAIVNHA